MAAADSLAAFLLLCRLGALSYAPCSRVIGASVAVQSFPDYSERQSALVRSRRAMKEGTKTVRAAKVVSIRVYMEFLLIQAHGITGAKPKIWG
jgi:hypothetical protein